mgnify:CR=1 FL=1
MKTYEFNMLNRDDLFNISLEVVDLYQHTWTTRFEMELLEEAQDILDQVWRDQEDRIAWADSIICSR